MSNMVKVINAANGNTTAKKSLSQIFHTCCLAADFRWAAEVPDSAKVSANVLVSETIDILLSYLPRFAPSMGGKEERETVKTQSPTSK